jgi:hypothetical protein
LFRGSRGFPLQAKGRLFPRRTWKGCLSRQILFKYGFVRRPSLKFFIFIERRVLNLMFGRGDKSSSFIGERRAKLALLRRKSVKISFLLSPAMTDYTEN